MAAINFIGCVENLTMPIKPNTQFKLSFAGFSISFENSEEIWVEHKKRGLMVYTEKPAGWDKRYGALKSRRYRTYNLDRFKFNV